MSAIIPRSYELPAQERNLVEAEDQLEAFGTTCNTLDLNNREKNFRRLSKSQTPECDAPAGNRAAVPLGAPCTESVADAERDFDRSGEPAALKAREFRGSASVAVFVGPRFGVDVTPSPTRDFSMSLRGSNHGKQATSSQDIPGIHGSLKVPESCACTTLQAMQPSSHRPICESKRKLLCLDLQANR